MEAKPSAVKSTFTVLLTIMFLGFAALGVASATAVGLMAADKLPVERVSEVVEWTRMQWQYVVGIFSGTTLAGIAARFGIPASAMLARNWIRGIVEDVVTKK